MNFRREKRLKVKALFDLTPLLNVVLLLVLFFMLSSTFTVTANIPIEAATLDGPAAFTEKGIDVLLFAGAGGPDDGGKVLVDNKEVNAWDDVTATLRDWHEKDPGSLLVITPEGELPSERLLRVLSIANALGIEHYVIAAKSAGA